MVQNIQLRPGPGGCAGPVLNIEQRKIRLQQPIDQYEIETATIKRKKRKPMENGSGNATDVSAYLFQD